MFEVLVRRQLYCYFAAVFLGIFAVWSNGFRDSLVELLLCLILACIGWIGPQVVHELAEINDQLAGRSKELKELLKG